MSDAVLESRQALIARWTGFTAMCLGMFMAVLDIQIVVTSLTVIEAALGIGVERMSWVQTAYLIAEVIAIPLSGLLTRVLTLRWLVTGAIAGFTLASIACACAGSFEQLIVARVLQGLAGGVLIPLVFSAIFLLFRPGIEQTVATTMGGVLAVLAPALGPISGGYITEHFSWHWLFLINVIPGIVTGLGALICLPREKQRFGLLKGLDWLSLALIAVALASLEIALKEAPGRGWLSGTVAGLLAVSLICLGLAIRRPAAVVDFTLLKDRNLAFGCAISFLLGAGLFGSVYLLPVFLSLVRHHGPFDIGLIVMVTGIAQIIAAPVSVFLDRKFGARVLTAIGFGCFGIGLAMSGFETRGSDYNELFWGQVMRGSFAALCILPATRFALGLLPLDKVGDASGLYNLSRNLGGAIGIALVDTVLFSRGPEHAAALTDLMTADPPAAAALMGMSDAELPDPDDPLGMMGVMDYVQEASLTMAINEAWLMLSGLAGLALVLVWLLGPIRVPPEHPARNRRENF